MMEVKEPTSDPRPRSMQSSTAEVLWLPSYQFVATRVDCPKSLSDAECTSLMELALESHSPFPIEQIFWGYYRDLPSQQALLYMGLKEQFSASESAIKYAHYVYPTFMAGLSATNERDGIQIFADSEGLSALWLEANTPVPKKVFSRSWAAFGEKNSLPQDHDALLRIVSNWARELNSDPDIPVIETFIQLSTLQLLSNSCLKLSQERLYWQDGTQSEATFHTLKGDALYACDVRDTRQIQKLKANALTSYRLWRALQCSGILALAMSLIALALFLGTHALERQQTEIRAAATAVEKVQQKEALLASLDLFSVAALQPFEALERMNQIRPDALYFTSLQAGANRQTEREKFFIKLKAVASSAAQADKFSMQLQADPFFSEVRLSKLRSKTKRTDFELEVQMPASSQLKTL